MAGPVFFRTRSGHTVFVDTKADDCVDVAIRMARTAEGIGGEPQPGAALSDHGILSWSVGQLARQALEASLRHSDES